MIAQLSPSKKILKLFWREIKMVFTPLFAVACLIVAVVDYTNGLYYFIAFLCCFGVAFFNMFRHPEERQEFKGDD